MIKCKIVTPDKLIYDGDVESLIIPGVKGEFGVLKDHVPLISFLTKGRLILDFKEMIRELIIDEGFAEVKNNEVNVLTKQIFEDNTKAKK